MCQWRATERRANGGRRPHWADQAGDADPPNCRISSLLEFFHSFMLSFLLVGIARVAVLVTLYETLTPLFGALNPLSGALTSLPGALNRALRYDRAAVHSRGINLVNAIIKDEPWCDNEGGEDPGDQARHGEA